MIKRTSKEEKLDRIVNRLQLLHNRLTLSFQDRKPFEILFEIKELENYKGLIEFSRTQTSVTFGINLLTSLGAILHRFEVSFIPETSENPINYCIFTSLPYSRGKPLEDLKVSFTTQVPFETHIRQMVVTSCKRDNLLTPLVVCLERVCGWVEYNKMFSD